MKLLPETAGKTDFKKSWVVGLAGGKFRFKFLFGRKGVAFTPAPAPHLPKPT
jgi:hypothetical protein